jgi:drug/metabolite transporter (DMT)-like permease
MRGPVASYGALGVLTLIWGSTWAAIRISLEGIPPFAGVSIRFSIAGLLLLAIGRALGVPRPRGSRIVRLWTIETLFGFVVSYGVVYWVEQTLPSGLTSVIFSTFPIFVALIAHVWLEEEPLGARALLGLIVGVAGVAVIYSEDLSRLAGPGAAVAAVVLLASPVAAALSHVAVKKWGAGVHPIQLATVPMLATGVIMGGVALLLERDRPMILNMRSVGALFYLVLFGSVVTFTLYYWVLARLPATRVSLMTYVLPIVALSIGIYLFDEPWSARTFAGTGLVVVGVAMSTYKTAAKEEMT